MGKITTCEIKGNEGQMYVERNPDEDHEEAVARALLDPELQAAATLNAYESSYENIDLVALIEALKERTSAVNRGDTNHALTMLTAQAHTLNAIFNNLAQRAIGAEYIEHFDSYLKLALRAQSQCRATWEAVSTIKNPPVMGYVRQANIAAGPQQVNNGSAPDETSRARENQNQQNKLLEEQDGQRLDPGAKIASGGVDQELATMGEVDRAED